MYEDVFEQMHWLCFHLEFEHPGDPDEPCSDPACHARNEVFLQPLSHHDSWLESFTTVSYKDHDLEKFLQAPTFLSPEDVRNLVRQARFTSYLAKNLLALVGETHSDHTIVRIAKAALGNAD